MDSFSNILTAALCFLASGGTGLAEGPMFRDGDRILLLGNTLIEREQTCGEWEGHLLLAHPDKGLQVRNLGWSADTVWAESRGMFDPPARGYERMLELVRELSRPGSGIDGRSSAERSTVIILGYGGVEAFSGPENLPRFIEQYRKLVDDLSAPGMRRVHLSPLLMEPDSLPVATPAAIAHAERYNESAVRYAEAIREISEERGDRFIDLTAFQRTHDGGPLTGNGIHLSAAGYAATGRFLAESLGGSIDPEKKGGLPPELREAIMEKNRLFFHRWRPQNFTYLFGFRKHEQGQNAAEIARFDPLIADAEKRIEALLGHQP